MREKKLFTNTMSHLNRKVLFQFSRSDEKKYIIATTNPPIIPLSMLKLESSHFLWLQLRCVFEAKEKNMISLGDVFDSMLLVDMVKLWVEGTFVIRLIWTQVGQGFFWYVTRFDGRFAGLVKRLDVIDMFKN